LSEFREISQISEATTAKRMTIGPYCQRQNCSPLNILFSSVYRPRWRRCWAFSRCERQTRMARRKQAIHNAGRTQV